MLKSSELDRTVKNLHFDGGTNSEKQRYGDSRDMSVYGYGNDKSRAPVR